MNGFLPDDGGARRRHEVIIRDDEHPRFQPPLQGTGRIDADDLPYSQVFHGLQIGLMVDEMRQDVAARVFPVTGDENDLGGTIDQRPTELGFHLFFPQVCEDPFSLQKDGSQNNAQRFQLPSLSLLAKPHDFRDHPV